MNFARRGSSRPLNGSPPGPPGQFTLPDKPPRKVKRRRLRCHGCGKRGIVYFTRRSRCLCTACQKVYDPSAVAAHNRITFQELARRIKTKGCE